MDSTDFNDVLPNWQQAGTALLPKSDLYASSDGAFSLRTVDYGGKHFLRVKNQLKWLRDYSGQGTYTNDPGNENSYESSHMWTVRSSAGTGWRNAVDPQAGSCVKYGDVIWLQSNYADYQWLTGGRLGGNHAVLTRNFFQDGATKQPHFEWIIQSNHTINSTSIPDPRSSSCVRLGERFYLRNVVPESETTKRWLSSLDYWTQYSNDVWSNLFTSDISSNAQSLHSYKWSFEAHELG
mmetsp:Transcript_664/g.1612  ORF Transcript_664/g.1612 Transcript_664/m.1612 type:complete len:237 (-) Transcript_664:1064-1774(-)